MAQADACAIVKDYQVKKSPHKTAGAFNIKNDL